MWKFEGFYDIDYAVANPDNRFRLQVDHFRGGSLVRTYDIFDTTTGGVKSTGSSCKAINGGGFQEDVLINDEFYFRIENMGPEITQTCRMVHWTIYATPRVLPFIDTAKTDQLFSVHTIKHGRNRHHNKTHPSTGKRD